MASPPSILPPPPKPSAGVAGGTAGAGSGGSTTWVWTTGSTVGKLTQVDYVRYVTQQQAITRSDHTIKSPRCKVIAEWRDSTPRRDDEEPDICEWVVKIDPGRNWMEWSAHLTWERWCRYISPDGDIDTAFSKLKALAKGQYRLEKMSPPKTKRKYAQGLGNALMFTSESAARQVADAFGKAIGEERLEA